MLVLKSLLTDTAVTALVTALNEGVITGYDVNAFRTNANRRQQGQLIDVEKYSTVRCASA